MKRKDPEPAVPCPFCDRVLVNRLVDHCQYCNKPLPPSLCLSDREKRALIEKHAEWREKLREERKNRKTIKEQMPPDGTCGFTCGGDF